MSQSMSDLNKVISAFTVYKFIKRIITPFNQMDAYKLGIIDNKGKFLKKYSELTTSKERKAGSMFNRLVINLKKIIKKVPDPKLKAQLTTLPTAIVLVKEEVERIGGDGEYFVECFKDFIMQEYSIDIESLFLNESFEIYETVIADPVDSVFGVPIYRIDGELISALELNTGE